MSARGSAGGAFDLNQVPEKPSWICHIGPMFVQHARQYPSMRSAMEMADYGHWIKNQEWYRDILSDAAKVVPKLHFLSDKARAALLQWLKTKAGEKPLLFDINSKKELMAALQTAVQVEFATLPPYLTAMFSIIDGPSGSNKDIYSAVHSIVIQEMGHFAMACNLLVAIGGRPLINTPAVVPTYPGPLPGGLRENLTVRLRKLSKDQLADFMSIEKPDKYRVPDQNGVVDINSQLIDEQGTIGEFYEQIKEAFKTLDAAGQLTYGNAELQTVHLGAKIIRNVNDAVTTIVEIVEEGEGGGTPENPYPGLDPYDHDGAQEELGHYYKFAQVYRGKAIVSRDDHMGFSYSGAEITIDDSPTTGVYPMMDDPDINKLEPGSQEYQLAETFADTYKNVVDNLQNAFTVDQKSMGTAVRFMFDLSTDAKPLMQAGVGTPFQLPANSNS